MVFLSLTSSLWFTCCFNEISLDYSWEIVRRRLSQLYIFTVQGKFLPLITHPHPKWVSNDPLMSQIGFFSFSLSVSIPLQHPQR